MRDKIKSVLDEFYNVNMFNEHTRQMMANEIEKAITGESTVENITKPIKTPLVKNEKVVEDRVKRKNLPSNIDKKSLKKLDNRSSVINGKKSKSKKPTKAKKRIKSNS